MLRCSAVLVRLLSTGKLIHILRRMSSLAFPSLSPDLKHSVQHLLLPLLSPNPAIGLPCTSRINSSTHHLPVLPPSLLHPFPFRFSTLLPSPPPGPPDSNSLLTCAKEGALSPINENSSRTIPSPLDLRYRSAADRFSAIPFPTTSCAGCD